MSSKISSQLLVIKSIPSHPAASCPVPKCHVVLSKYMHFEALLKHDPVRDKDEDLLKGEVSK